jgi:hypothetical protein
MNNNKQSMKLYTEEQVKKMIEKSRETGLTAEFLILTNEGIELPSDEEIESRYNKFIDTEIKLGFLKQEQGERLKWYYKTYFIDKIQGGNNEQQ